CRLDSGSRARGSVDGHAACHSSGKPCSAVADDVLRHSHTVEVASVVPRVLIVGAGFGGLYPARAFKLQAVDVTIVDRRNHHVFQPLLYQVATAALSPGDIA